MSATADRTPSYILDTEPVTDESPFEWLAVLARRYADASEDRAAAEYRLATLPSELHRVPTRSRREIHEARRQACERAREAVRSAYLDLVDLVAKCEALRNGRDDE
ncbi:MAG: hypothetical protein QM621_14910 [Aeromicrobium sp.]|uniref:hypothetical protein n=1 Tax=Aeromicrobium sp. TaxID=1871063 RepID=UPI0039E22E66